MVEKCEEVLSLKVSEIIHKEYQQLSDRDKKTAKRIMLDALCEYMWSRNHYDRHFYFGEERDGS